MHVSASIFTEHAEPKGYCPLCNKAFYQDSTLKRHYYYCRSKCPDLIVPRRRACVACVRAKTRCTWMSSTGMKGCARCHERGTKCDYQPDLGSDPVAGLDVQGNTSFTLTERRQYPQGIVDSQVSRYRHSYPRLSASIDTVSGNDWESAGPGDVGLFDLPTNHNDHAGSDASPSILTELSGTLITGLSSLQQNRDPPSGSHLTSFRHVMRPRHVSLVSLATRLLQSYPYMLLQNGTFPPFLSPQLYMWAGSKDGPPQQALSNCISLVQRFKLQKEGNQNFVWGQIKSEQERILAEYTEFNQWELLACLQSLLFYRLLRLQGGVVQQDRLDISLLNAISVVFIALSVLVKCDCGLPNPNIAWRDWIFNESRRRTTLVIRALDLLVYDSATISCFPAFGSGLILLPSKATLWTPFEVGKWKSEFDRCLQERTVYGLSESGNLMKLQHTDVGIQQTLADWDEWSAEVGELAALVSVMGELLR